MGRKGGQINVISNVGNVQKRYWKQDKEVERRSAQLSFFNKTSSQQEWKELKAFKAIMNNFTIK